MLKLQIIFNYFLKIKFFFLLHTEIALTSIFILHLKNNFITF